MNELKNNISIIKSPAKIISELTNYSDSYISLVISGKRENKRINEIMKDIIELQQIVIQKHSFKK